MTGSAAMSTSIVGVGATEFSKDAGRSETRLAAEAIGAALADAGLTAADVDGLVSFTVDPVEETELVRSLGIPAVRWSSRIPYGGGGSQGMFQHAAAAVLSGAAQTVVVYRACRSRSGKRFGRARVAPEPVSGHSGTTAMQWCTPYGVLTPASWMSFESTRYMHDTGTTSADFGRAVVQFRDYAATNPAAYFSGRPITLDDHQNSRWIAEPAIRLFDCCQETDGAVAMVVTSTDRAADTPAPVQIIATASVALFEEEVASNHYRPDLSRLDGAAAVGESLFRSAGLERSDVDVAMIYDAFTPMFFLQLEALGFCGYGEAKDFVADGNLGPTGALPCNTNGGLIGEAYIHGMNLTLEAVRQLRGQSPNQLDDPHVALVSAGRTGVLLRR